MKRSRLEANPPSFTVRFLYLSILVIVTPLLTWNSFVQQMNAGLGDVLLRLRAPAHSKAAADIVLVAIDDATVSRYGPLPLRRSTLAEGLGRLAQFRPRVVAVDLLLSEATEAAGDQSLVQALRLFPAVVLSAAIEADAASQPKWILPLPEFGDSHEVAHVHAAPDADGNVRSVLLLKAARGKRFWALGLQAARAALHADHPLETRDYIEVGPIPVPAKESTDRLMTINFAGPEGSFRRVPFASLLGHTATPDDFRDKVVFVGVTAQGSGDRLFTPVSPGIGMSGIEIHANVTRTILDRAFLVPLGVGGELAAFVLIAAACVLGVGVLRGVPLLATLVGIGLAIVAASAGALRWGHIWPLGAFLAVFLVSAAVSATGEYAATALGLRVSERKRRDYAFRVQAIAHEIKTPLTAIQGSSEIISDQLIPDAQRVEMAGMIHRESKRLTEIIHAFLDVERMASGSLHVEKQPTALDSLCESVVERARLYAARKKIQIASHVPSITVPADADLLSFAIYNLLTNAVKYSPKQTTIALEVTETRDTVCITVTDQGYGIAPGEQKRIFDRFYRVKRGKAGPEEGSGIGLALVQEIVVQHGGSVLVESKEGVGSRFTLLLPRAK